MFVVTCNGKKRTHGVWSLAVGSARTMSIFEMEPAQIWSEDDPFNPFAEFSNGMRTDEDDNRTFKIGGKDDN